jgi:hypothetical protein
MAPFGVARGAGQPQDDDVWDRAIGARRCIFMEAGGWRRWGAVAEPGLKYSWGEL